MNVPVSRYWSLLVVYLQPQRRRVLALGALLISSIVIQLLNPQLVREFIDSATSGGEQRKLMLLAAAFVVAGFFGHTFQLAATWLSQSIGWAATNALRADLFSHCLGLDLPFHKTRTPGEMIERIDGDVTALSLFFSQLAVQVLGNLVVMAGVLVLLFVEDLRIGAVMTLFTVFALAVMTRVHAHGVPAWAAEREAGAQFYGAIGEILSSTEDLRANGARGYALDRFDATNRDFYAARRRSNLAGTSIWASSLALFTVAGAVVAAVCAWLWDRGDLTLGGIYIIFYYTELLRHPLEQLRQQLQELQAAGASIGRVEELLRTTSALADDGRRNLPDRAVSLEFDRVSFGYDEDDAVLHDVRFSLAAGRRLGVVGRTGSGKTTLSRLLFRLYDPGSGEVRLDGVALRDYDLAGLRGRIGMVSQDVQVFDASVRDNLTFFDASVSDDRLLDAIGELGLSSWLATLSAGLDTPITASGLSAGEAQLLAFARVRLKDPCLVVLDEASSRLDPGTERLISAGMDRLLAGRTAVIIAHRLQTLDAVDEVLVLEDGRVVEYGPRAELVSRSGSRFAELLAADLAGAAP